MIEALGEWFAGGAEGEGDESHGTLADELGQVPGDAIGPLGSTG